MGITIPNFTVPIIPQIPPSKVAGNPAPKFTMDLMPSKGSMRSEMVRNSPKRNDIRQLYPNLFSSLGNSLIVNDVDTPTVKRHLSDISKIPEVALKELSRYGYKIYVGDKPVSDFPGMTHEAETRPPGWGEGQTFKDVAGLFTTGRVYLGKGTWDIPSLALHELSHAIGEVKQIYSDPELQRYYEQYQPKGDNSLEEFFAGSASEILLGLGNTYSKEYKDYVHKVFGSK